MDEPRHIRSTRLSVEQLIQLKRSEKPPAGFWEEFDREFHRRQLVALVTIEPWYRRAARTVACTARRLAPLAAGAAAIAVAVVALLQVETSRQDATQLAEAPAMAELDTRTVLLPEEAISISSTSATARHVRPAREEFRGSVRSAPQELASGLTPSKRFVAVSAPVTFSSGSDTTAIYSTRALTAGSVLRGLAAAAPESL